MAGPGRSRRSCPASARGRSGSTVAPRSESSRRPRPPKPLRRPVKRRRIVSANPSARRRRLALMAGNVLLVEDEPSVGELVRSYLTRDGYHVIWVRSGEDALVELDRHQIRIVLLDVGLPGMDGFDVCRAIRARSQVPILMLTARDEEPDKGRRARGRGRRLPDEAVLAARARRADEGDPPPVRPAADAGSARARRRRRQPRDARRDGRRRVRSS